MRAFAKLYLSSAQEEGIFGEGKWRLLKAVKEHGSIMKAAVSLDRSYRKAWGDIKKAEQALKQPLVIRTRGGANGGRTEVTDLCIALLDSWEKHRKTVFAAVDKSYARHLHHFFDSSRRAPRARNE